MFFINRSGGVQMKAFFKKINRVMRHFTVLDIGVLKLCLLSIGIILGVYLFDFFDDVRVLLWIIFVLSWLYIVVKVFGFYWDKEVD